MVQPWLGDVQEALHDLLDFQRIAIKGKIREIKKSYNGTRSLEVGRFSFITTSEPRTTLVKYQNKQYGLIIDNEVFKYRGSEKEPISVGKIGGGNENDQCNGQVDKPVEREHISKSSSHSHSKPKSHQQKDSNRSKKRIPAKRHSSGSSRLLRYLWSRH